MKNNLRYLTLFITLAIVAMLIPSGYGAIPPYLTVWEARTTGSATNGGGFVTATSGTDMSLFDNKNAAACTNCQSATVNISTTDGVSVGTGTVTSITGNYSAAIIGNVIQVAGVWYEVVTFTNATTITMDRNVPAGTSLAVNIGGSLTFAQANTNMALAAGSGMWVKATGNYSVAATINLATGMSNTAPSFITGYTSVRGDNGQVTVLAAPGLGGSNSFIFNFSSSPYAINFQNFKLDCNNLAFTRGINLNQAFEVLKNVFVTNCADEAFAFNQNGSRCEECWSTNTPSPTSGGASTTDAWINSNFDAVCINCVIIGTSVNNATALNGMCGGVYINMIMANFSGSGTDAMKCSVLEGEGLTILNLTVYGFTRDAIRFQENSGIDFRPLFIRNALISNVGGYCFNYTGNLTLTPAFGISDHNVCNTNGATGFYNNWPAGTGDIAITFDPFVAGASNNFAINTAISSSITGMGYPGALGLGGTGFIDPGALQSQSGGGGGGTPSVYGVSQ